MMAKIIWTFDFKVMDDRLDWLADSRCYMLWDKPRLPVQFTKRPDVAIPDLRASLTKS